MSIVNIALPLPIMHIFDYILPSSILPIVGVRVQVPFRNRQKIGIIKDICEYSNVASSKLKTVSKVLDDKSLFSNSLWRTLNWAINYYHYPAGIVLFQALPALLRRGKSVEISTMWQWNVTNQDNNTLIKDLKHAPKQQEALTLLLHGPIDRNQINKFFIDKATIHALRSKELCYLKPRNLSIENWRLRFKVNHNKPLMSYEQINAVSAIQNELDHFAVWLLAGVTGSGKTEVYLELLEHILSKGQQALVLVPEINLTPQTVTRFHKRFYAPIEVLHSKLSDKEKLAIWIKARHGECAIVIGTRSALFTPFYKLGIIIIDEEHDSSYKQHKGWRYHARDLAISLAKEENIPIVLGTATPSLETIYNVQKKKYRQLTLAKRAGSAKPVIQHLLDIKGTQLNHGISDKLLNKMRDHLQSDNQIMIFLNRRGFAPVMLCHYCGWILECQQCNHYYTLHKCQRILLCHYCNNYRSVPKQCQKCGSMQLITIGLGTEQVETALTTLFPNIPITRIDLDTTKCKGALEHYLSKMQINGARILIGTQMLAKGHHFPNVTLVTLLDVDGALFSSDFRATEHFAQLYTQVAGRAGRTSKQGEVLLQTRYPEHPLIQTLMRCGYMNFAYQILEERRQTNLPPFTSHVLFYASSFDSDQAETFLIQLRNLISNNSLRNKMIWFMGPMPSVIPKRKGRFYWQLRLLHSSRYQLQRLIANNILSIHDISKTYKVKWSIDVDPN